MMLPPAPIERWEVLDLLTNLVQKSLVNYEEDEQGGGRYRLLETVRQYAWDRLLETGEGEAVRSRHLDLFLALAEEAEPRIPTAERQAWLDRLEQEHDNLREALAWSRAEAEGGEKELRLAGALGMFWNMGGYLSEGRDWLEAALTRPGAREITDRRAKALWGAGILAAWLSDTSAARSWLEESAAIWRDLADHRNLAWALHGLARVTPGAAAALPLLEEAAALLRGAGDPWELAFALFNLGEGLASQYEDAEARSVLEESLAISGELGDTWLSARPLRILGQVALIQGDSLAAAGFLKECLKLCQETGRRWGAPSSLHNMRLSARCFADVAAVASAQGLPDRAARLFGAAEAQLQAFSAPGADLLRTQYARYVGAAVELLGEGALEAAWREGRAMSLHDTFALALATLGAG